MPKVDPILRFVPVAEDTEEEAEDEAEGERRVIQAARRFSLLVAIQLGRVVFHEYYERRR